MALTPVPHIWQVKVYIFYVLYCTKGEGIGRKVCVGFHQIISHGLGATHGHSQQTMA